MSAKWPSAMPSRFHAPYSVASAGVSAASSMRITAPSWASACWIPPLAIVVGPGEVPVGENGCLASAMRSGPPASPARCARAAGDASTTVASTAIRVRIARAVYFVVLRIRSLRAAPEEVADQRHHLVELVLEREVAGVEQVKLRARDVSPQVLVGRRGKDRVVLAPHD